MFLLSFEALAETVQYILRLNLAMKSINMHVLLASNVQCMWHLVYSPLPFRVVDWQEQRVAIF